MARATIALAAALAWLAGFGGAAASAQTAEERVQALMMELEKARAENQALRAEVEKHQAMQAELMARMVAMEARSADLQTQAAMLRRENDVLRAQLGAAAPAPAVRTPPPGSDAALAAEKRKAELRAALEAIERQVRAAEEGAARASADPNAQAMLKERLARLQAMRERVLKELEAAQGVVRVDPSDPRLRPRPAPASTHPTIVDGDAVFSITACREGDLAPGGFQPDGRHLSPAQGLVVEYAVRNASPSEDLVFSPPLGHRSRGLKGPQPALKDEGGKAYRVLWAKCEGASDEANLTITLKPGQAVKGELLFDGVPGAGSATLTFDKACWGGQGMVTLTFPPR
jgi:hypothetical protein